MTMFPQMPDLEIPTALKNALVKAGINTVEDLKVLQLVEILRLPGVGQKGFQLLLEAAIGYDWRELRLDQFIDALDLLKRRGKDWE